MGCKLMNCCKMQPMGTQGCGKMLKIIQVLEDGGSQQRRQETGGRTKEKNHKNRVSEASEQVRNGRFYGAKRIVESCWRKDSEGKRSVAKGKG